MSFVATSGQPEPIAASALVSAVNWAPEGSSDPQLTFSETFDGPLSVSAWGPGTTWIAHPPYGGNFSEATFIDPVAGDPFTVANGSLTITAALQSGGNWTSGLLASVDPQGNGFSQQYGYFEIRAKLPTGGGVWPAFWLLGVPALRDDDVNQAEIDVMEEYGNDPTVLHTNSHVYLTNGISTDDDVEFNEPGMTTDFHTYGVLVTPTTISYYFDRQKLRQIPTPPEAQVPLYILLDLGMGGGWPIDPTLTSASMVVSYVKVWTQMPSSSN